MTDIKLNYKHIQDNIIDPYEILYGIPIETQQFIQHKEKFTEQIYDDFCIDRKMNYRLMMLVSNQSFFTSETIFGIYKININNYKFEEITNVVDNRVSNYCSLESTNDSIIMEFPHPIEMIKYFNNNSHKTYIVCPLSYTNDAIKFGHAALIVFDMIKSNMYVIDPNGDLNYFDDIYNKKLNNYIEFLFGSYCSLLNDYGKNMNYIPYHIWNKFNFALNFGYSNNIKIFDTGNCVGWALFLAHIISVTNKTINIHDILKKLNCLSDNHKYELIYNYQANTYKYIVNHYKKMFLNYHYSNMVHLTPQQLVILTNDKILMKELWEIERYIHNTLN